MIYPFEFREQSIDICNNLMNKQKLNTMTVLCVVFDGLFI